MCCAGSTCEQASAESVPGPSVVPGGGWGAPHTHCCSQAQARGRAAPVAEGNGAEEGLGAASWRQVDGWGAPAVSDSVGLSCICRVVLFMKYTDGNRCPYRGIKESFGLVSICSLKKKKGGWLRCELAMLFNVLYFLYMFLTNLVLSLYVRCPGSDRIAGRFLCSLNFPERQKSEEQFHIQCFYCSRVGSW